MNSDVNADKPATVSLPAAHWTRIIKAGTPASSQARASLEELYSDSW